MKLAKTFLLLACLPFFQNLQAQAKQQPVPSNIQKVTVFVTGAHVVRQAKTSLPAGKTELVFKDISPNIDKQSIQVKGDGQFTILSVIHQLNHLQEQARREEITQLENQKGNLNDQLRREKSMLAVWKQEEEMLKKNQSVAGQSTGLKTADLREAIDFQRERLTDVLLRQLESEKTTARLDSAIKKLDKQLVALNQKKNLSTSEILVTVSAKESTSANFELSYYVRDAGWFVTYDLRVKDVSSPIDLAFKANVRQSSGEDWKDVKLVLSNGDPTESGLAPTLAAWNLRYGRQNNYASIRSQPGQLTGVVRDENGEPLIGATVIIGGTSIGTVTDLDGSFSLYLPTGASLLDVSYTGYNSQQVPITAHTGRVDIALTPGAALEEVVVTALGKSSGVNPSKKQSRQDKTIAFTTQETYQPTTINFEIEVPYTILNDGKTYTVDVKSESVPAIYEYLTVPKVNQNAYLTAKITDWQDLNLLDGEANLFFEGAFLGKSLLDTRTAGDTLEISLGVDKSIVVQRKQQKEFTSRQFLGGNKTDHRAYQIILRNNKQQAVSITVKDQFPISTDKNIQVENKEAPGAEVNEQTQILTWKLNLAPREERKLSLKYSVKYPKGQTLVLD